MKKLDRVTLLFIALATLMLSGCKTSNNLSYLNNLSQAEGVIPSSLAPVTLQPQDELRISVSSQEPAATAPFNLMTPGESVGNETETTTQRRMQTYIVDAKGDIDFPVFGKIHVAGMTTGQLKEYLHDRIAQTVKDPLVRVELINFKVKVMGEVKEPQIVEVKSERFTVLDALAAAGDMTEFGNRERVLVMRQQEDGNLAYGILNLQDSNLASSPFFVLQQNDVVYADPSEVRQGQSKYSQYSGYKLSVISTIVSASSVIASLVIALAVK